MTALVYSVEISNQAKGQIAGLERPLQERFVAFLERISPNPFRSAVRLSNSPFYRFRVGSYRIIAEISLSERRIFVLRIGKRENIYKKRMAKTTLI